jgi:hypothetical protein
MTLTSKLYISSKELGEISTYLVDQGQHQMASNMRLIEDSFIKVEQERDKLQGAFETMSTQYEELKEAYDEISTGHEDTDIVEPAPPEGDT